MINTFIPLTFSALLLSSLPILAAENLSPSEQAEREAEFQRVRDRGEELWADGFDYVAGVGVEGAINAEEFIKAQSKMETLRLRESGVRVLKTNRRILQGETEDQSPFQAQLADLNMFGPGAEIPSYYEIASIPVMDSEVIFLRPMNPEEVLEYEREAQGVSNDDLADTAKGMADGIAMMMSGLGSTGLPTFNVNELMEGLDDDTPIAEVCRTLISGGFPNSEAPEVQAIALILAPECFMRVTADHLRQLDEQTAEEKELARNDALSAFDQPLQVVDADEDYVTFGLDLPAGTIASTEALQRSLNQMVAAFSRQLPSFPDSRLQRLNRDSVAQSGQFPWSGSRYVTAGRNTFERDPLVFGQFGLFGGGNRNPEPAPETEPMSVERYEITFDRKTLKRTDMKMYGTMGQGAAARPVIMEQGSSLYQQVPGSTLFEPYRETSRATGRISPAMQEQMRTSLADMDRQMAGMPASQRSQMESMMGGQMDQMRSMANDGAIEVTMITTSIEINPQLGQNNRGVAGGSFASSDLLDLIAPGGQPSATGSGGQGTGGRLLDQSGMVRMIQVSLDRLGYNPGPANGQLERETVIAITQFEAAKGMPVTGQATPQLAGILAAEVDALP